MSADLWAIIPVKPFQSGKSRLAPLLERAARTALNRQLFDHVFGVTVAALGANRVAVVTADVALAAQVDERGACAVVECTKDDLNAALGTACRSVMERGAQAIMVIPSDLPFLAAADMDALRCAVGARPCCVIAPDASGQATNALVLAPPDPDFFRFGPSSFAAHHDAAAARGVQFEIPAADDLPSARIAQNHIDSKTLSCSSAKMVGSV